ncbi:conserved protein of unknown function [Bartonella clarridgeiae 73]|uniref:Uncharacterized protein n=1 Tax=Bartonella clarridgeiae (strain CCUG 45776 / CIP 104772 / 73) TaxID=696125 RepID=E6YGD9_BARC7|nr:conserved protein of unknown function [Bartonella clarridgeiae 73]
MLYPAELRVRIQFFVSLGYRVLNRFVSELQVKLGKIKIFIC